jgi:phenylacetate-CoA ligase
MARYDDWPTDREVTYEKVQAFLADSNLIGKRFLGKYRIATTSGLTGTRVFFVIDEGTDAAIESVSRKMMESMLGWAGGLSFLFNSLIGKNRTASLIATGAHTAAFSRVTMNPDEKRKVISVHLPLS